MLAAYIAKYGNSFYAELAKARMEELKRKQQLAAVTPAKPPVSGPDPAFEAWNSVKDSQNVDALQTFVGKYPLTFYADLARMRLQDLKAKQLAASVAAPLPKVSPPPPDPVLEVWNATKDTDSVNVLDAFVGKYPNSFYAELAKARIEELKRRQQVASLAPVGLPSPAPDQALEAWNAIKTSKSTSVLLAFVDKYPLSLYAEIARARIEELKQKQDAATREAMVRETQRALKDIECYSGVIDGVWSGGSKEALDRLSRLAKIEPASGEPDQGILDKLKSWRGDHCPVVKTATPRKEKAVSAPRDRHPPKVAKPPQAEVARTQPTSATKERSIDKPRSIDTSVYCHQGCAGGFEGVLSTTATNPGMKR